MLKVGKLVSPNQFRDDSALRQTVSENGAKIFNDLDITDQKLYYRTLCYLRQKQNWEDQSAKIKNLSPQMHKTMCGHQH